MQPMLAMMYIIHVAPECGTGFRENGVMRSMEIRQTEEALLRMHHVLVSINVFFGATCHTLNVMYCKHVVTLC